MGMEENEKAGSDDAIRKRNPIQVRKNMCMLDQKVDPFEGPPRRSKDPFQRHEWTTAGGRRGRRKWVMGVCGLA